MSLARLVAGPDDEVHTHTHTHSGDPQTKMINQMFGVRRIARSYYVCVCVCTICFGYIATMTMTPQSTSTSTYEWHTRGKPVKRETENARRVDAGQ